MEWRSAPWVRWLGWTALYAVLLYVGVLDIPVGFDVLPEPLATLRGWLWEVHGWLGVVRPILVPALIAFLIGVRFRSWWWGLGPLVVCILPVVFLNLWSWFAHRGVDGLARDLGWVFLFGGALIGG